MKLIKIVNLIFTLSTAYCTETILDDFKNENLEKTKITISDLHFEVSRRTNESFFSFPSSSNGSLCYQTKKFFNGSGWIEYSFTPRYETIENFCGKGFDFSNNITLKLDFKCISAPCWAKIVWVDTKLDKKECAIKLVPDQLTYIIDKSKYSKHGFKNICFLGVILNDFVEESIILEENVTLELKSIKIVPKPKNVSKRFKKLGVHLRLKPNNSTEDEEFIDNKLKSTEISLETNPNNSKDEKIIKKIRKTLSLRKNSGSPTKLL